MINIIDFAGSIVIFTLLFAFIFRIVPEVKNSWKKVRLGTLGASIIF
ncbi:MAG: hypothetical protein GX640_08635 [Fibrobacter sp.]|nr:hypothetical protein [Fibrobacter sp.]